jgi:hypothetical protein
LKLTTELNNGRLAMVAMTAMLIQNGLTGPAISQPGNFTKQWNNTIFNWNIIMKYLVSSYISGQKSP